MYEICRIRGNGTGQARTAPKLPGKANCCRVQRGERRLPAGQEQRIAAESSEEREARLQLLRHNQQQRIASETPQETEARRRHDRESHVQHASTTTSTVESTSWDITNDTLHDEHLQQSFVPIAVPLMTEQEAV